MVPVRQAIYYLILLRPSPLLGVLDFYLLVPFSKLFQRRYRVAELTLRDRLGAGNFGQVCRRHLCFMVGPTLLAGCALP